jgi:hypothetical protein
MYTIQTNATWQVISANASLAFQVTGYHPVLVALSTNTAPRTGFRYDPGQGDRGDQVTLFPSATGNLVWARSSVPSEITVA